MAYSSIAATLGGSQYHKPPRRKPPPTPSYPTAELGGSQYGPSPDYPEHTTVVTSGSGTPRVTRVGGTQLPRSQQPTLPDYLATANAYLTTAEELRAKYLGGTQYPNAVLGSEPSAPTPDLARTLTRPLALGAGYAGILGARGDTPLPAARQLVTSAIKAADLPSPPMSVVREAVGPGASPKSPDATLVSDDASKLAMRLSAAAGQTAPAAALVRGFVDPVTGMKLSDSPYATDIAKAAIRGQERYGVPASVTLAVTGQESGYGTNRGPSSADAVGIGQGIPSTRASQLAAGGPDFWAGDDPNNPTGQLTPAQAREQTLAASYLLGSSLDQGKSLTEALDAYTGGYGSSYNDPVGKRARAFAALDEAQREPIPQNLKARAIDALGRGQAKQIIQSARAGPVPVAAPSRGEASPVPGKNPQLIGFPHQGTHTLGNWQSDNAIDIAVPTGTPIRAAEGGTVDKVYSSSMDPSDQMAGIQITIGGKTFYTHLSKANVQEGDRVSAGDVIGLSGAANGVEHLHFATRTGNPEDALSATGASAGSAGPSERAVNRFIQPNESPQEVAGELGVPTRKADIEVSKLSPELQRALVQLGRESGDPVSLSEGFRTRYRQEQLASGQGGATGPAAAPGTSQHELGQAVDVSLTPEQTALAGQFGLTQTVSGEPWHYEVATDDPYSAAAASTGGASFGGAAATTSAATASGAAAGAGGAPSAPQPGATPTFSPATALPFAARAALPGEYQGPGAATDFQSLVSGSGDASELATKLERFRPRMRL